MILDTSRLREARLKSHLKQPDDITRPATDKAASILSGAKRNVEILKKQLDDRQVALDETRNGRPTLSECLSLKFLAEDTLERLKRQLDEKRRTTLLLSVLEQKEKIRVKRFQEMTKMIADLRYGFHHIDESKLTGLHYRKSVSETKSQVTTLSVGNFFRIPCRVSPSQSNPTESNSTSTLQPSTVRARPPRVSHTQNALTVCLRYPMLLPAVLTRLAESSCPSSSPYAFDRAQRYF